MKSILIVVLFCLGLGASAQSWETSYKEMVKQYDQGVFDKCIESGLLTLSQMQEDYQTQDTAYANTYNYLAYAYFYAQDYEKAVEMAKKECILRKQSTQNGDQQYINAVYFLAISATYTADYEVSINAFEEVLQQMALSGGKENADYLTIANQLAGIYDLAGSYHKAEVLYDQTYETAKQLYRAEDSVFQVMTNTISTFYITHGMYEKAEPFFIASLQMMEQYYGKKSENYITVLNSMGEFYLYAGWYDKCETTFLEFTDLCKDYYGAKSADYATSLNNLAVAYEKQDKYEKAEKLYLECLKIKKKVFKKESNFYALSVSNLAVLYDKMGERKKSEELFNEAIEIYKILHGAKSENYSIAISSLASVYSGSGKLAEAEKLLIEALDIQKSLYGENYNAYINSLNNLGQHHYEMGKYELAETELEKVCLLRKKNQGENHPDYASSLHTLANVKSLLGKNAEAEQLLLKAINVLLTSSGKWNSTYINTTATLASVYMEDGKYQKAEEAFEESIVISEKTRGKLHPDHAVLLNNMALFYMNTGYLKEAEEMALQALKILHDAYGENDPNCLYPSTVLANVYKEQGRYPEAEKYTVKAMDLAKEFFGTDHPNYANAVNNLAVFYYELGNYNEAEKLYTLGLEVNKSIYPENHKEIVNSLNNIGALFMAKMLRAKTSDEVNEYAQKAKLNFNKVLQMDSVTIGVFHPDFATHLNNMAELYRLSGNFTLSEEYYLESLRIQDSIYGENNYALGITYNNMGLLYENKEEYNRAIEYYEKAIAVKELNYGNRSSSLADSYINLASLLDKTGDKSKAYRYFKEGFEIDNYNIDLNFSFLSENEKLNYLKNTEYYIDLFNSFCVNNSTEYPEITSLLYDNELRKKGMILKSSNRMKSVVLSSKDTSLIHKYNEWITTKQEIAQLNTKPAITREKNLDDLEIRSNQLEKELINATFNWKGQNKSSGWNEVKRSLQKNEVAIEFCDFYRQGEEVAHVYCAILIHPKREYPVLIELCSEQQLEEVLGTYGGNNYEYIRSVYGEKNKLNSNLYTLVWKPLETFLEGITSVYYSPTGLLNKVSFAAMGADASVYLSEKYDLILVSSTGQVRQLKNIEDISIGLFGGAQFTTNVGGTEVWKYLEGTKSEVEEIDKLFRSYNISSALYMDTLASEANFKRYNNQSPAILHIATHGFFYPDLDEYKEEEMAKAEETEVNFRGASAGYAAFVKNKNPLMRSGVVFTGANNVWNQTEITGEDGILTAYEVSNMNLSNTEMVVLSACETGLGEIKGSEGVYGLQRAFKAAGVNQLVMSLWQVPDAETQEFMAYFYAQLLKTKNPRASFLVAQQKMKAKYDPYFWAAFVLVE